MSLRISGISGTSRVTFTKGSTVKGSVKKPADDSYIEPDYSYAKGGSAGFPWGKLLGGLALAGAIGGGIWYYRRHRGGKSPLAVAA